VPKPTPQNSGIPVGVWRVVAVDARVMRTTRAQFSDALRTAKRNAEEIEVATIILGELLANACEHGKLPVGVELHASRGAFTLVVTDEGYDITRPAFRHPNSLRGRGFEIIEALGAKITLSSRPRSRVEVRLPFAP
jgi:anti-sigma regulatory factor (Ser/Thr protein kinase)